MKNFGFILLIASLSFVISGYDDGANAEQGLYRQLAKHPIGSSPAVMLKKRSMGGVSWLLTVHGYPNNLSVCQQLIAPYNVDRELSVIEGEYFCEEIN